MANEKGILIVNADVYTCNPSSQRAEAIGIREDRHIVFVGSNEEARDLQLSDPFDLVIDAQGRTVMPGFNDAHFHLSATSFIPAFLDLTQINTLDMLSE